MYIYIYNMNLPWQHLLPSKIPFTFHQVEKPILKYYRHLVVHGENWDL